MNTWALNYLRSHTEEVLAFLKTRYPLYHLSNVFFRDIQFGIQAMLKQRRQQVGYREAEQIARAFIDHLVAKRILIGVDNQTWVLHYPEFRKPFVKPPAKPAASAPPAPGMRPAGAMSAKPASSPVGATVAQPVRPSSDAHAGADREPAGGAAPVGPPGRDGPRMSVKDEMPKSLEDLIATRSEARGQ